ncbi:MAG: sensor histidine kinase [Eubacteriales bacterium]|nr:sensor histidine kinase [Eubacteriales bacterium]
MSDILNQVSGNLDRYVRDLNMLSMMPLAEEGILEILRNRNGQAPTFVTMDEQLTVNRFHTAMMFERSEIKGYLLFCLDGTLFANTEHDRKNTWKTAEENWTTYAKQAEGDMVFVPRNKPVYYTTASEEIISVVRLLRDPMTLQGIGYVKIDLYSEGFRRILYPSDTESTKFYVYTASNELIYPDTLERESFVLEDGLLEVEGRKCQASSVSSRRSGLSIFLLYPFDVLQKDALDIQQVLLSLSLISLILSIVVSVAISDHITKPLRILYADMIAFGEGNLSLRTEIKTNDEIGTLASGFNKMADRIQNLVIENYQIELNRREAEIMLLQSQMNPHFLYNILETISMSAMSHNDLGTSDIVVKLGKMLRYSISAPQELVKLRNEVQFCEDYLDLQIMRLEDRLSYEINLNAEMEDCLVPKLILQPFVENVVMHALEDAPVHLWITALIQWDSLLLLIKDNGSGISEEKQRQIEESMYANDTELIRSKPNGTMSGGMALGNVHKRIRMMYGDAYGVSLLGANRGETVFLISLPLIWSNEET